MQELTLSRDYKYTVFKFLPLSQDLIDLGMINYVGVNLIQRST